MTDMTDETATTPVYDRELSVTLNELSVWTDGRVAIPADDIDRYGLEPGTVLDMQVQFDGNGVPLPDTEVTESGNCGVIRIPAALRSRYGIPTGAGATVDLDIRGVVVDAE